MIVTLNTATSAIATDYTISGTGTASGTVTPYLTNTASNIAAQPALPVSGGRFSATVPARSLVSYVVRGGTAPSTPPATSATPSSPPTSPPPAGGTGCAATYAVTSTWPGGYQADVTVTNNSSATLNGWTVRWTLPSGAGYRRTQ